jgi:alpha-N-arabinofuranosidase
LLTIIRVINAGASSVPLTVNLDAEYTTVNGTILTANDVNAFNFIDNPHGISPKRLEGMSSLVQGKEQNGSRRSLKWDVPRWSITVLQFNQQ